MKDQAGAGAIYCLGIFGALVYFITTATSFLDGVWGVVQSIFWPAVLVYEALELLRV